jgi:hypothetical protein
MNKSIRLAVALAVGTSAGLAQAETVYCVHDDGLNDSQFCYVPIPPANQVLPLGPLYRNCDIEALDIQHEEDSLFAASGDDTPRKGHLYRVVTPPGVVGAGDIFDLGNVVAIPPPLGPGGDIEEIDAISFHPNTGDLWGWAQDRGLFVIPRASVPLQGGTQVKLSCHEEIAPYEIQAEMVIEKKQMEIEAITWNQNGTALYGVENCHEGHHPDSHGAHEDGWGKAGYNYDTDCGTKLWRGIFPISPASWMPVCQNLLSGTPQPAAEIEAIESLPPGFGAEIGIGVPPGGDLVLLGFHGPNQLSYAVLFIPPAPGAACAIVWEGGIESKFNDIEGLAYSPFPIP